MVTFYRLTEWDFYSFENYLHISNFCEIFWGSKKK